MKEAIPLTPENMLTIRNGEKICVRTCESVIEGTAEILGMDHPALSKLQGAVMLIRTEEGCIAIGKRTVKEGSYSFSKI